MGINKLMEFRTTYLRAVAEAWADPAFHHQLTTKGQTIHALEQRFAYQWPWNGVCDLEVSHHAKHFEWLGDEWIWSKYLFESLTLSLPLHAPPQAKSMAHGTQAMALADYYRQRSSLFSDDWGQDPDPDKHGGIDARPAVSPGSGAPIGGFVPGDQSFETFKLVLLAAIAKAWTDDEFKRKLEIDSATALHSIRGYTLPWEMTIRIQHDENARWHAASKSPDGQETHRSRWTFGEPHTLKLYLPTRPSVPASEPIALAMYNAAGAEYPFTCCG
jgi:ribosomally synthesized peptide (two-chain TOMM family)